MLVAGGAFGEVHADEDRAKLRESGVLRERPMTGLRLMNELMDRRHARACCGVIRRAGTAWA